MRKACPHKRSETPGLARPHVAGAPLVLDDSIEPEEANGGSVRVYFNLKASRLPGLHFGAMAETGSLRRRLTAITFAANGRPKFAGWQPAWKHRKSLLRSRSAWRIPFSLGMTRGASTRDKGIILAGLRHYPVQDLAGIFQSGRLAKMQFGADQGRG
jgi:hypothetical protein